jgi:UDP-N-acetylmuramate dehydrogenase
MSLAPERGRVLAELTSLGLGGPAELFVEARDRATLAEAVTYARTHGLPLRVLGGGTNLVIADEGVRGLVLHVATRGIRMLGEGLVEVEAGEPFGALVEAAVAHGLQGLECLAGVPGSCGATPVQNVGAYGQEVADTIEAVEVLERATGESAWLARAECGFAYRDSRFKREPERFVVLCVRFRLRPGGAPALRYAELVRALASAPSPSLRDVADAVLALRARKSMLLDPRDPNCRSVGSFFTNPIVSEAEAERVKRVAVERGFTPNGGDVPVYSAQPGYVKLSAAWLIERAGVQRGHREGQVGVSTAHTLCLVHHGGGNTRALLALAGRVCDAVRQVFGVELEREPVCW